MQVLPCEDVMQHEAMAPLWRMLACDEALKLCQQCAAPHVAAALQMLLLPSPTGAPPLPVVDPSTQSVCRSLPRIM